MRWGRLTAARYLPIPRVMRACAYVFVFPPPLHIVRRSYAYACAVSGNLIRSGKGKAGDASRQEQQEHQHRRGERPLRTHGIHELQ